jgi:hypothetical protein
MRIRQTPDRLGEFIVMVIPRCHGWTKKEKQLARDGERVFGANLD